MWPLYGSVWATCSAYSGAARHMPTSTTNSPANTSAVRLRRSRRSARRDGGDPGDGPVAILALEGDDVLDDQPGGLDGHRGASASTAGGRSRALPRPEGSSYFRQNCAQSFL